VNDAELRVLSKKDWEAMNEEYRRHRRGIVREIALAHKEPDREGSPMAMDDPAPTESTIPRITSDASYPAGCLIFARNLDPSTNKTALRALFGSVLDGDEKEHIDYIDFSKGMDTVGSSTQTVIASCLWISLVSCPCCLSKRCHRSGRRLQKPRWSRHAFTGARPG
jgi:hypothetical protein